MAHDRRSRGVLVPSLWHVAAAAAAVCGAYLLWISFRDREQAGVKGVLPGNLNDRLQVVESLVERGSSSVPELVQFLASSDPKTRYNALYGLSRLGREAGQALPKVRQSLSDEDPHVRESAVAAYARICDDDDDRIATISDMIVDVDPGVRDRAARILEQAGPSVIPRLVEKSGTELPAGRLQIMFLLQNLDPLHDSAAVAEVLRRFLSDDDAEVRTAAAKAGAAWGVIAEESASPTRTLQELQDLFEDETDGERLRSAIWELRRLKSAAKPAIPVLLRRIERMGVAGNEAVVEALVDVGADRADVIRILTPLLLDDSAPHYPFWAGNLLARASPEEARRQVARIGRLIEEDETNLNHVALHALWGLASQAEEAVPVLTRLAEQSDSKVQTVAVEALGRVGPSAARAVPTLIAVLERVPEVDSPQGVLEPGSPALLRKRLIITLGQIGPASRSAVPQLLAIIDPQRLLPEELEEDGPRRLHPGLDRGIDAVHALGKIGDGSPEVLAALRELLTISGPSQVRATLARLRAEALQSLMLVANECDPVFADFLKSLDDESPVVRTQAALAIGRCRETRDEPLQRLTVAVSDENPYVRTAAALALREIGPAARSAVPALRAAIRHRPNSAPNRLRAPSGPHWMLETADGDDLTSLSVAEAARQALKAIEPAGSNLPEVQNDNCGVFLWRNGRSCWVEQMPDCDGGVRFEKGGDLAVCARSARGPGLR